MGRAIRARSRSSSAFKMAHAFNTLRFPYYHNEVTKRSQWEKPDEPFMIAKVAQDDTLLHGVALRTNEVLTSTLLRANVVMNTDVCSIHRTRTFESATPLSPHSF